MSWCFSAATSGSLVHDKIKLASTFGSMAWVN
jgi:hypothetical protein